MITSPSLLPETVTITRDLYEALVKSAETLLDHSWKIPPSDRQTDAELERITGWRKKKV